MRSNIFIIVYVVSILAIFLTFILWKDMSDSFMLLLAAFGFILTSIFTYSRRK
ncbi:MAG: hypothetical protein KAJ22_04680 [Candidatus Izimaplasma sp.]|nr:hypothetical protein [Candidatus Izimaplasma bacterium]